MSMAKNKGKLGFRDLHGFNLALLGKQCWNLLTQPNALVSRLLKARYYPDGNLLQAVRMGRASFTWSGIWEAKENMNDGLRWVLEDGKAINILSDRWLKGKTNFCVDQSVAITSANCNKVCDFFIQGQKVWNEAKVRETFNSIDAEAILKNRIPQSSINDRLAWVHSSNGQYSVKTGYHRWQSQHMGDVAVQQSDGWGKIWRLCIPHKVKIL